MQDAGVSVGNVCRDHCYLEILHKCLGGRSSALESEGDDTAGSVRHILLSSLIVLVTGKSGISHPCHLVMAAEIFGDLLGVLAVPGHADSQ